MDAHERIWSALSLEVPDRVPTFCQHIEKPFLIRYDQKIEIKDDYGLYKPELAIAKELGLDSKWTHSGRYVADQKNRPDIPEDILENLEGKRVSDDGHIYEINEDGHSWYVDGILKSPELIRDWISYIKTFEPAPDSHWDYYKEIWENGLKGDFVPIPTAGGPTYTTWASIGLDRLAYILRKYPQLFKDLLRAFTDITIEMHKCLFEKGIDIVFICDDHAFKDRCMFSPKQFEEFLVPNFQRMADNAHKHGAKFIVHTDGNLHMEIPYLARAGVDAVEPLEYEANNNLKLMKEKYGDKICLIGNVAASDVLSYGSVADTVRMTKKCLLDASENGGYILAPGSDVLGTIKIENMQAMVKTVKKFGKYPINRKNLKS